MSRRFTDESGHTWTANTDEAHRGRLEFTDAAPRPTLIRWRRFLARTVLVGGLVYGLLIILGHDRSILDTLIAAAAGLAAGALQRRTRAQREEVVYEVPFALRRELSDAELRRVLVAAIRYRDDPDATGPIELRAATAYAIRQETA